MCVVSFLSCVVYRHMILPHRLMPYSQDAIVKGLGRKDVLQRKTTASAAPIGKHYATHSPFLLSVSLCV